MMDDAGKGGDRRPYDKKVYDKRYEAIDFSKPIDKFKKLLDQLYSVDNESEEADDIRDEMDGIYLKLSKEEIEECKQYSEDLENEKKEER